MKKVLLAIMMVFLLMTMGITLTGCKQKEPPKTTDETTAPKDKGTTDMTKETPSETTQKPVQQEQPKGPAAEEPKEEPAQPVPPKETKPEQPQKPETAAPIEKGKEIQKDSGTKVQQQQNAQPSPSK